jgi:predicted regulator of Ras-like GTPase activity (Roadblock/LC7/MglB family)
MAMEMSNFRIKSEAYSKIQAVLSSLYEESEALLISLISRSGQEIVGVGEDLSIDRTGLAALAASNLAATSSIAELVGEEEFERLYHRGLEKSILMIPLGDQTFILFVLPKSIKSIGSIRSVKSAVKLLQDLLEEKGNNGSKKFGL